VTERPDAVDRGAEHPVGSDVAAVVGLQSDAIEIEAIGGRTNTRSVSEGGL
jgi:hypothetical protein